MKHSIILFLLYSMNTLGQPLSEESIHVNHVRSYHFAQHECVEEAEQKYLTIFEKDLPMDDLVIQQNLLVTAKTKDGQKYPFQTIIPDCFRRIYSPGPSSLRDLDRANHWNHVFSVDLDAIQEHIADYADGRIDRPIKQIFGWPGKGNEHFDTIHGFSVDALDRGAHFIENPQHLNGVYEPQHGEYPFVPDIDFLNPPQKFAWLIYHSRYFNDDKVINHEIHHYKFAYSCSEKYADQTIFSKYEIYFNHPDELDSIRIGLLTDPQIGCPEDDYLGCHPKSNLMFAYNADSIDGQPSGLCHSGIPTASTWKKETPVLCIQFLNRKMSTFNLIGNENDTFSQVKQFIPGFDFLNGHQLNNGTIKNYLFTDPPSQVDGDHMIRHNIQPNSIFTGVMAFDTDTPLSPITLDIAQSYHLLQNVSHISMIDTAIEQAGSIAEFYQEQTNCSYSVCDCECLWPGDTDNNGRVNYLDAIPILKAFQMKGPVRNNDVRFIGQNPPNWNGNVAGVDHNISYADANGNGIIDHQDLTILSTYDGYHNYCASSHKEQCPEGEAVFFEGLESGEVDQIDFSKTYPLILNKIDSFWGISYEIKSTLPHLRIINSSPGLSWLKQEVETRIYNNNVNFSLYLKQVVMMNDQGKNEKLRFSERNEVDYIRFFLHDLPDSSKVKCGNIKILNFTIYYEDGSSTVIPTKNIKICYPESVIITDDESISSDKSVDLFPNPSKGEFQIVSTAPFSYQIINLSGHEIKRGISPHHQDIISIKNHPPGMYLMRINIDNQTIIRKLLIAR